jgi:hypothetical protein
VTEEQYLAIHKAMVSINHYSQSRIVSKKPYHIWAADEMIAILNECPSVDVDINQVRMIGGESRLLVKISFDMEYPGMYELEAMELL